MNNSTKNLIQLSIFIFSRFKSNYYIEGSFHCVFFFSIVVGKICLLFLNKNVVLNKG